MSNNETDALPAGWALTTIGEVVKPDRPKRNPKDLPDLPFIGMEHVQAHSMRLLGTVPAYTMNSNSVHFQPGDVLYGRLRPYLNKVICPDFEGLCSAEFIVFSDDGAIEPKFLQYRLNAFDFVSFATHLNEGDRPRVDFSQIGCFHIALPPRSEQRRIIAEIEKQVSRLDVAVAALKQIQANLKRYRASTLRSACEGRLVPTEAELAQQEARDYEPADVLLQRVLIERRARWEAEQLANMESQGRLPLNDMWKGKYEVPAEADRSGAIEVPEGWITVSIGQIAECLDSMRVPVNREERAKRSGTTPYYGANGQVGWIDGHIFDEPLVLVVEDETFTGREKPFTYKIEGKTWVNNHAHVLRATTAVHVDYLNYSLSYYPFTPLTTGTTGRKKLIKARLMAAPYALPPFAEQVRIVAEVERRLSIVEKVEASVIAGLKRAERLRQGILQRAFAGKLVPQDANDEPASILLDRIRAERTGSAPMRKKARPQERIPKSIPQAELAL